MKRTFVVRAGQWVATARTVRIVPVVVVVVHIELIGFNLVQQIIGGKLKEVRQTVTDWLIFCLPLSVVRKHTQTHKGNWLTYVVRARRDDGTRYRRFQHIQRLQDGILRRYHFLYDVPVFEFL